MEEEKEPSQVSGLTIFLALLWGVILLMIPLIIFLVVTSRRKKKNRLRDFELPTHTNQTQQPTTSSSADNQNPTTNHTKPQPPNPKRFRLSRPPSIPIRLSSLQPRQSDPRRTSRSQGSMKNSPISPSSLTQAELLFENTNASRSPVSPISPKPFMSHVAKPELVYGHDARCNEAGTQKLHSHSRTGKQDSVSEDDEWRHTHTETIDGVLAPREWV